MSQSNPVIGANLSGLAYRTADNNGSSAFLTTHSGSSVPSYAVAGTIWLDTSGTPWLLKIYDGADSITIGAINATTNTFLPYNGTAIERLLNYAADTGAVNAYAIAPSPAIAAYATGLLVTLKPVNANTGASTVNVNGLGTKNVKMLDGSNPPANAMLSTGIYLLMYDGTNLVLLNPSVPILYLNYAADTGSVNAYAVAPNPPITAYAAGQHVLLKPGAGSTGACTINVNTLGAKSIKGPDGSDPPSGAMVTTGIYSLVYDGTNFVLQNPSTISGGSAGAPEFSGRLTLTTGVSVTTSDVTGATTIYYTPHRGDQIGIYNGSAFVNTTFTELSNATAQSSTGKAGPAVVANNSNYDLFVWNDSGTIRLTRGPLWTSDTARGTGAGTSELQQVKGIWTNKVAITNGPGAGLGTYVGTVRSNGSAQINDSAALRHVWNTYNRVERAMVNAIETTDTWAYTLAAYRQANANAANQLDYVVGLSEDAITADVLAVARSSSGSTYSAGIGLDSTTVNSAQLMVQGGGAGFSGVTTAPRASYKGNPGIGRHYLAWLEYSDAAGTTTWIGDNAAPTRYQSGIIGSIKG